MYYARGKTLLFKRVMSPLLRLLIKFSNTVPKFNKHTYTVIIFCNIYWLFSRILDLVFVHFKLNITLISQSWIKQLNRGYAETILNAAVELFSESESTVPVLIFRFIEMRNIKFEMKLQVRVDLRKWWFASFICIVALYSVFNCQQSFIL